MHLVIPFAAGISAAGAEALHGLHLPHLESLLARLEPGPALGSDEHSLNLPHEQVLAQCRGWVQEDGRLPFAAAQAAADGVPDAAGAEGWGLLTPTHWQVGREQVVLRDPDELALGEDESKALLRSVRPLFDSEDWALHWGAPLRWYARHASLAQLATASIDRVIGRAIDPWLPDRLAARQVRRLQSEVQMLWHDHALNEAREARGALAVNSFWLSGTGPTQSSPGASPMPDFDLRLREPLLTEDWAAWVEAWQALDRQRLGSLDARVARGESLGLTLCGERRAQRFDTVRRNPWTRFTRRWRRTAAADVLRAL